MINGAAIDAETIDGTPPYSPAALLTGSMVEAPEAVAGSIGVSSTMGGVIIEGADRAAGVVGVVLSVDECNVWHTFGRNRAWHPGC